MNILEIIMISISLAMDAFAVSICKGMSINRINLKKYLMIAFYFGLFQAIMPLLGFFLGSYFSGVIQSLDHWVAFILLAVIGFNMLMEDDHNDKVDEKVDFFTMILLAIATSIDALTVGITLSFFNISIYKNIFIIGTITFIISFIGCFIGYIFGDKFNRESKVLGGLSLIFIGLKILIDHLKIFTFI